MIVITPQTKIDIMKGVPLSADGKHTFVPYAATSAAIATARDSAFSSYIVLAETHATIVDGSTIKVTVPWNAAETALTFDPDECNYLRYKNDPIDNNYRYCYITNCEYVNPNTFLFTLKEDYFTTWAPYANIRRCFIRRQHSATDAIGDNVVPENFELGKLVFENSKSKNMFAYQNADDNIIVALCGFQFDGNGSFEDYSGGMYGGFYSGITMYAFFDGVGFNKIDELNHFLGCAAYAQKSENILGIFTLPHECLYYLINPITGVQDPTFTAQFDFNTLPMPPWAAALLGQLTTIDIHLGTVNPSPIKKTIKMGHPAVYNEYSDYNWGAIGSISGNISDYRPKNNKLFTYPYCYIIGTNNNGQEQEYRYEWFNDNEVNIDCTMITSGKPEATAIPQKYLGLPLYENGKIISQNFSPSPYIIDSYMVYMGQYAYGGETMRTLGNVIAGALPFIGGASLGAATGSEDLIGATSEEGLKTSMKLVEAPFEIGASIMNAKNKADRIGGAANFGYMEALRKTNLTFYPVHITNEYAEKIDKYFSMFGYAENRVTDVNIFTRLYFNYVETTQSLITSNMIPQPAITAMQNQLDNGITIWHSLADVGDYSLTNSIRS